DTQERLGGDTAVSCRGREDTTTYEGKLMPLRYSYRISMALLSRNYRRKLSVWAFNRASQWWDFIVPGFTNAQWVQNFRMSEETVDFLCIKLCPVMERQNTTYRDCVTLKKRVAIALWKLVTGSDYRSIGHLFGVSIMTVCRSFVLQQKCCWCQKKSGSPTKRGTEKWLSILRTGGWSHTTISTGKFWNVSTGLPGSLHDARVLRLSILWELASRGNLFPPHIRNIGAVTAGYYILGDSAYPVQDWLLKSLYDTGRLTAEQHFFNQKFSRARVVVENAFGRLKGRWRCLLKRNDYDTQLVKSMVLTCCALHNLCEDQGETYETSWDVPEAAAAAAHEPAVAVSHSVEEGGRHVRDALVQYLSCNS
uniref:DDE Tnp4 domain-containing protein n=1 Tax=Amphiprion ocellaris TaxID=80972 RepID=A0A3Q1AUI2_AMPOC